MSIELERRLRGGAAAALLLAHFSVVASDNAPSAPQKGMHTVTIDALRYSPPTIEVNKGDTIVWRNKDPFPHTVTAQNHAFDSGQFGEGKAWKFKANQAGEFTYICTLHPTMKGVLIVK
jgi:plastocyanin